MQRNNMKFRECCTYKLDEARDFRADIIYFDFKYKTTRAV